MTEDDVERSGGFQLRGAGKRTCGPIRSPMVRGFELLDNALGMPVPPTPLWSIVDVRFGHQQDWPLELTLKRSESQMRLIFRDVVSFRGHDESEIINHWVVRAEEQVAVGSVYRIVASTYLDEFAEGTAALVGQQLTHYLIAGYDLCVEVLASRPPDAVALNVS